MAEPSRQPPPTAPWISAETAALLARLSGHERLLLVDAAPRGALRVRGRIPQMAAERARRLAVAALGDSSAATIGFTAAGSRAGVRGWLHAAKARGAVAARIPIGRGEALVLFLVDGPEAPELALERARAAAVAAGALLDERQLAAASGPVARQFERALVTFDARGIVRSADAALETLAGRPLAEMLGNDFSQLLDPRARPRFRRTIERCTTSDRMSGVFPLVRGDGAIVAVNIVCARAEADGQEAFLCHLSNLSTEEAARLVVGRVATAIFPEPGTTIRADRLLNEAAETLDLRLLAIAMADTEGGPLRISLAAGPAVLYLDGVAAAPSPAPWERVFLLGSALEISDFEGEPSPASAVLRSLELRSFVGFPMRSANGSLLGVLLALASTPRAFFPHEKEALKIHAEFLATDLDRRRAEAGLERRAAELAAMLEAVRDMSVLRDPAEMLRSVTALAVQLVPGAQGGMIFVERGGVLFPETFQGPFDHPGARGARIPVGAGVIGRVFEERVGALLGAGADLEWDLAGERIEETGSALPRAEELLAVPLIAGERALGVLCVGNFDDSHEFEPNDLGLLQRFASFAAAAIVQTKLYETVRQRSALVDAVREGVLSARDDGTITFWNDGAVSLFGWRGGHAPGTQLYELFHPGDASALEEGIAAARATGHWLGGLRGRRLDGVAFDASVAISPLEDPRAERRGETVGWVVIVSDVTERRRLEAHALHSQTLDSLGKLAAGIAHDFNNLLGSILGYTSLVRGRLPQQSPILADVDGIEQVADQAAGLAKRLLVLGRSSPGTREVTDLNEVAGSLVDLLQRGLDPKIQVELQPASRPCPIDGDATALRQALLNLATNSRDALPDGGKITFATEWIEGDSGRPKVAITVRDDGVGMEPEVLRRIYEPFFTTKPPGKGTGLGCAIVFATVRAHGGDIECSSKPNEGTTFRLLFPASAEAPQPSESKAASVAPPRGSGTVLLVEDEETLRRVTADLVAQLGYEVIAVPGGLEAIEVARARGSAIDLVLLDLTMPGMSGEAVFHTLRALDPSMRIILTTGFSATDSTQGLLAKGAAGLLQKPYRVAELARALQGAKKMPRVPATREIV